MEGPVTARLRRVLFLPLVMVECVAMLAGSGCSNYIGTTAASYLRRVREDPDPNVRYLAYAKLASPQCYDTPGQKSEAVRVLIEKLEKGREPVASRAVICRTLGELRDPAARDVVVKCASDPEPVVRVEACRALGKVGKPGDATVLTRVMAVDTFEDCRIAAIDALGELKPDDPRITQVLAGSLQNDDPATRFASLTALRRITGRDLGVDPTAWQKQFGETSGPTMIAGAGSRSRPATPTADVVVNTKPVAKPAAPAVAKAAPRSAAVAYPPQPAARPDPDVDGSTRPAGYPPQPQSYVPR